MGNLKNKKGFTLVELLAVIVILGIVTVIGATTVLPYIQNAGKDAFKDEANHAIDAAGNGVSLIQIGSISTSSIAETYESSGNVTGYCFTLKNLVDLGLWTKDSSEVADGGNYAGYVRVNKNGNAFTYVVMMHNKDWTANSASGSVTDNEVTKGTSGTFTCPAS